ncbi:MAG TPA: Sec-independent protein translocase protein TatB [Labilithrix sp.]|nr:Sec-independent protein translocase protein TatB [Labilithrix sp.]
MFGFSFSELVVVVVVALVVMGPKDLPHMLRRLGQWAGKIRRAAADLRAQSGIDEALRSEGLSEDLAEIRKLARGELDAVQRAARVDLATPHSPAQSNLQQDDFYVVRDREYPRDGADAYGALPDDAVVYAGGLPKSALARDPLYLLGDADAELPSEPGPEPSDAAAGASVTTAAAQSTGSAGASSAAPTLIGSAPSELAQGADASSSESPSSDAANGGAEAR